VNDLPPNWFGQIQAAICVFGAAAFFTFWYKGTPEEELKDPRIDIGKQHADRPKPERDYGFLWMFAAVTVWAVFGVCLWWFPTSRLWPWIFSSTIVNGLVVLVVSHMDHSPDWPWLKDLQAPRRRYIVLVSTLVISFLLTTLAFISENFESVTSTIVRVVDTIDQIVSILVSILLGYALFLSFRAREYAPLAWLSIVSMAALIIAQPSGPFGELIAGDVGKNIKWIWMLLSKQFIIAVWLAHAQAWADERAFLAGIKLHFTGERQNAPVGECYDLTNAERVEYERKGKKTLENRFVVEVNDQATYLSAAPHKQLLMFAAKQMTEPDTFINIKHLYKSVDKVVSGNFGGSLDKAELRRIWQALGFRKPIMLFKNNGQNGRRLRVRPHNISFSEKLKSINDLEEVLSEFPGVKYSRP
jgi:hypothetical protein